MPPLTARSGRNHEGPAPALDRGVTAHLALFLGALAVGRSSIRGLDDADGGLDRTAVVLQALGATVQRHGDGLWTIDGVGVGGLVEPDRVLDFGPCFTGLALATGLIASHPLTALLTGDATLVRRPLAQLIRPLEAIGAGFTGRQGGLLPLALTGAALPMPLEHRLPPGSDEIAAALLLAGLNTPGTTVLIGAGAAGEPIARLLRRFGAEIAVDSSFDGERRIRLAGQPELLPATLDLAADPA